MGLIDRLGVPADTRTRYGHIRRRLVERAGSTRYSRLAAQGLDDAILAALPAGPGFFVEAGAYDGLRQSNTYYLQRRRGWSGILVEPVPELYARCRRNRPDAHCVNAALVAADDRRTTVSMTYAGLMSIVDGAQGSPDADAQHVAKGTMVQRLDGYGLDVPARTLTAILDDAGAEQVGFLSLDVEGYELEALRGLDLERYCPACALVEAATDERAAALERLLAPTHELVGRPTPTDLLFRARGI